LLLVLPLRALALPWSAITLGGGAIRKIYICVQKNDARKNLVKLSFLFFALRTLTAVSDQGWQFAKKPTQMRSHCQAVYRYRNNCYILKLVFDS